MSSELVTGVARDIVESKKVDILRSFYTKQDYVWLPKPAVPTEAYTQEELSAAVVTELHRQSFDASLGKDNRVTVFVKDMKL